MEYVHECLVFRKETQKLRQKRSRSGEKETHNFMLKEKGSAARYGVEIFVCSKIFGGKTRNRLNIREGMGLYFKSSRRFPRRVQQEEVHQWRWKRTRPGENETHNFIFSEKGYGYEISNNRFWKARKLFKVSEGKGSIFQKPTTVFLKRWNARKSSKDDEHGQGQKKKKPTTICRREKQT